MDLGSSEVVRRRGFKPSDRFDPTKAEVLTSLTRKILHLEEGNAGCRREFLAPDRRLRRILTPPDDFSTGYNITPPKARKPVYGSSDFFSPIFHPSVDEQKCRAKEISVSITGVDNYNTKGQSMFYKRKRKSVKWVHEAPEIYKSEEYEEVTPNWHAQKQSSFPTSILSVPSIGKVRKSPPPPLLTIEPPSPPWDEEIKYKLPNPPAQKPKDLRNYNTVARGFTYGQPIYHSIYLS